MNAPQETCPDQQVLYAFLLGQMAGRDLDQVGDHLEGCARCVERVQALTVRDPVLDVARETAADPPSPSSDVRSVMEQVKQLGACVPATGAAPDQRVPSSVVSTPTGADDSQELPAPKTLLGRYRIVKQLGTGGMGVVYLAEDGQLQRQVAVKVPRFSQRGDSRDRARQRFLREVHSAAKVRHPHICAIHDTGEDGGVPFVVMDYIDGPTLAAELEARGRFDDLRAAVRLASQVARALQAVHAHGIVHRDLKPGNVLIDHAGQAFLTDFGLALVEDVALPLTAEGCAVGTPAYMAPEQVTAQGPVDARTDLYSLGLVLYQMVTGRLPFRGTMQEQIWQRFSGQVARPSSFRADVDPALDALILKAVACEPARRFDTAAALAESLEAWLDGKATLPVVSRQSRSRPRGRQSWAAAAGLAAAALGAFALWSSFFRPHGPVEPSPAGATGKTQLAEAPLQAFHIGYANRVVFSPTEPWAIISTPHGGVVILDVKSRKVLHQLGGHGPTQLWALAVSATGRYLLTGGDDNKIVLWDLHTKKPVKTFEGHSRSLKRVTFANGERQINSTADDGTVRTWDVATGQEVARFTAVFDGHTINATAFSADGSQFLNGREDGHLELYDVSRGKLVHRWKGHEAAIVAVAFSADGKQAASAGEAKQVHCWSLDDFRDLAHLSGHDNVPGAVAFVPGRPQVLTSDGGGDIHVWDVNTRKTSRRLKLHRFKVVNLLASPHGPEFLSMSPEGELALWRLPEP